MDAGKELLNLKPNYCNLFGVVILRTFNFTYIATIILLILQNTNFQFFVK